MGSQASAIGARLRAKIAQRATRLVLQIAAELRKNPGSGGTPVDTGHARANWVPAVGVPNTAEVAAGAYESGVAAVMQYTLELGALYVSNHVPYIQMLNYGHSKQAPPLFVEAAIARSLQRAGGGDGIETAFMQEVGAAGAANLADAYNPLGGSDD